MRKKISLKNVLNRPISRRRTAAPSGTTAVNDRRLQQRRRFLGKVALSKFARALLLSFKANYLGTSPFVSVGTIESQLFKAS
jgi:hypothetical protein